MNHFAANLRKLRLEKKLTQEQAAVQLGVSAQAVSRWETCASSPDVMLLPAIARLYGVLVDDLFRPAPKGYSNNALRLLAIFEHTHQPEDFIAAAQEFEKLFRAGAGTADDWRSYGVTHEYMVYQCIEKAISSYSKAMSLCKDSDPGMYHRTQRQCDLLRSRIGQGAACIAEAEERVRLHPDDPEAWNDLAHTLACGNQPERSLKVAEDALVRFPDNALLHIFAGDACRTLHLYEQAFPHWETALQLNSTFTDAKFSMAFCREELGQYAEAASVWDDIVRTLEAQGLEIEAQWPREMAARCRQKLNT